MPDKKELLRAGDALVVYLDCPPPEAKESRENAVRAIKEWQRLAAEAREGD